MPILRSRSGARALAALLSCAAAVSVLSHQALADTPLAGSIMFNRTLTLSESPYLVTSQVVVWNEATLTIEPGVVLRFEPASALIVGLSYAGYYGCLQGTLIANGTAEAPILFTSTSGALGGWQGIFFTGCSYGSSLTNCVVENGGLPMAVYGSATYTANVVCMGSQPPLSDCTIRNAQGNGIDLIGVASIAITDCTIRGNSGHGINCGYFSNPVITGTAFSDNVASDVVSGWEDFPVLEDCTFATGTHYGVEGYFQTIRNCQFSGSAAYGLAVAVGSGIENLTLSGYADPNAVLLTGFAPTGDPSGNVVLPALGPGQYYTVESPLTIRDNVTLHVSPGVTIKFGPSAFLSIGYWWEEGRTSSSGRLSARGTPASMITFTSLSGQSAGWSGIRCVAGASSQLDYCVIENGGVPDAAGRGYDINTQGCTPLITNSIIRNAPYCIYVDGAWGPTVHACAIAGASVEAVHDAYWYGAYVDVRGNWWGDDTGPYDPVGNPQGRGSAVGSAQQQVVYRPWLTCPPPIGEYRLEPTLTSPSAGDFWLTGEEAAVALSWTAPSPGVDHVQVEYSVDGGLTWAAAIKDGDAPLDIPASQGGWTGSINLPAADTTGAMIRLNLFSPAGNLLGCNVVDGLVVGNRSAVRLDVQKNNRWQFSPPVLFWPTVPGAATYYVRVNSDPLTSCRQISQWDTVLTAAYRWVLCAPAQWTTWPASRYHVTVDAYGSDGHWLGVPEAGPSLSSFIRFRLADLRPDVAYSVPPVVLIHGWISSQDTWYCNDGSPFVTALASSPQQFHPWALEYPNIGSVRHSAFGLRAAIDYLRRSPHTGQPVRLVAHSMGGLVCRTMLQGLAVDPAQDSETGFAQPAPPPGAVMHLVTLATPNLGEPYSAVKTSAEWHQHRGACDAVLSSQSRLDLTDRMALQGALNADPITSDHRLPAIKYLLCAGYDALGELGGIIRTNVLDLSCDGGNDATADVCSALGTCGNGFQRHSSIPFALGATVTRRKYLLSHSRMAKPGNNVYCNNPNKSYENDRGAASAALLSDVLSFLRDQSLNDDPCVAASRRQIKARTKHPGGGGAWSAQANAVSVASAGTAVPGAKYTFRPVDSEEIDVGLVCYSDAYGLVTAELPPGCYQVEVRAPGYLTQSAERCFSPDSADLEFCVSLELDPGYEGPHNPICRLADGAATVSNREVTVELSCDGATSYGIAESSAPDSAVWYPLAASTRVSLSDEIGRHTVYVWFKDEAGRVVGPVAGVVDLAEPTDLGYIAVNANTAAPIYVDGLAAGATTPATIGPLQSGYHAISVSQPGWRTQATAIPVAVRAGTTASVEFALSTVPPPGAAQWGAPAASFGPEAPLRWHPSVSAEQLYYEIAAFPDSLLSASTWLATAVPDTTLPAPTGWRDSTVCWLTVAAVDDHGTQQVESAAVLRASIDRTPPSGHVIAPSPGEAVLLSAPERIRLSVADWTGAAKLTVALSTDGGNSYPDTVYAGAYEDDVSWVPPPVSSSSCRLSVTAIDAAGNAATFLSDSVFTLVNDLADAPGGPGPLTVSLSVGPVPSRSLLSIRFDLPHSERIRLDVLDPAGRRVRTLARGTLLAGSHTAVWDHRGEDGDLARPGLYFVLLHLPTREYVRRVVVLR